MPQPRKRHRLALHCDGNPATATVELDGERLTFVSRVELVLDVNGQTEARLTVPAACLDIDVDAAAFVTAHTEQEARGEKRVSDHHRAVGRALPVLKVGSLVHYLRPGDGGPWCQDAYVIEIGFDGKLALEVDDPSRTTAINWITVPEDQTATNVNTWHMPCAKAKPDPEPEPDAPPTTVNIHVHGGVIDERQLADAVQRGITRHLAAQYSSRNTRR